MSAITDTNASREATSFTLTNWSVDHAVRRRLAQCSHGFVFNKISWQFKDGTLSLYGCVPSFYLKQLLQELLRDVKEVQCIANNVGVMSSTSLSSERSNSPR